MQIRQLHVLGAAQSAYRVLTTTPVLPSLTNMPAVFTQQVQTLGSLIAKVEAQASAQTAAGGTVTSTASSSEATAKHLHSGLLIPLRKMARIISRTGTSNNGVTLPPNFVSALSVPASKNHQALIAAARAAVTNVTPYKDLFIAHGMAADMLDQVGTQITTLTQSIQDTTDAKTQRVTATGTLETLLKQVRDTIHLLDLSIQQACKADPVNGHASKSAWDTAKNIRKAAMPTDVPWPASARSTVPTPAPVAPQPPAQPTTPTTPTNA